MAVNATYQVYLDFDNDKSFGTADDISSYWKDMNIQTGFQEPFARVARTNTLGLTVANTGREFSPESTATVLSSYLKPGLIGAVQATYGGTAYRLFTGQINPDNTGIRPVPDTKGPRTTQLNLSGWLYMMMDEEASLGVQQSIPMGTAVWQLLTDSGFFPKWISGWVLGVGLIGTDTTLPAGASSFLVTDSGLTTFSYAGDTMVTKANLRQVIGDIIESEPGWVYEGPDGLLYCKDSSWLAKGGTVTPGTILETETLMGANVYNYGGRLLNKAVVNLNPRVEGTAVSVVGKIETQIKVDPGGTRQIAITYKDPDDGRTISALNPVFVAGTDYNLNTAADGSGTNYNGNASITVTTKDAGNRFTIDVTNGLSVAIYLTNPADTGPGIQVRGTALYTDSESQASYIDTSGSRLDYKFTEVFQMPLLNEFSAAWERARWEVLMRNNPQGVFERLTFLANKNDTLMRRALTTSIGDIVYFAETQTGSASKYMVMGINHQIYHQKHHVCTFVLRPLSSTTFWFLEDQSLLGTDTTLGLA